MNMYTWNEFALKEPQLAEIGLNLLFPLRIGRCFLATIRKDGAPRLHPVSLVRYLTGLYVFIPVTSPKCSDLLRDGRFALQAFPASWEAGEEFYISGCARPICDRLFLSSLVDDTGILVGENEFAFELLCDRVMHSYLEGHGTSSERPVHKIWRAEEQKTTG